MVLFWHEYWKAVGLGRREIDLKAYTEEQGDATQTFRPSGNKGYERKDSIWEDCRQNCFLGQSTFQLLQEADEGIQEKKRLKGSFDEPWVLEGMIGSGIGEEC